MLRTLSIRDFVIVDSLELEFASGFSVLTGETGAGKSILIDALSLALGGRGDASMVREGAQRADICAEFALSANCLAWLAEKEFNDPEDNLILRRSIDNAGRSKAWINGIPATAGQVRELAEMLVDIHGQHAHQSLLKSEAQRLLLDGHGNLQESTSKIASLHRHWRALRRQREELENNARSILQEKERLEWQVNELRQLNLRAGEWEAISQEHSRLAHAASLLAGAQEAANAISDDEQPLLSSVHALRQKLLKLREYDAGLAPVVDTLEAAEIQLQESSYALHAYLDKVELDPARLSEIEARLEAIHHAARNFHLAPEQLPATLPGLVEKLNRLSAASDMEGLKAQEQQAWQAYHGAALHLSRERAQVARELERAVTAAMQDLSMQGGSFAVNLTPCEAAAHGLEQVEFLVAGHAGVAPRPLAKVASGGELARIALAISVIASRASATPCLIFDEVDSGIGGGVAEVVGRLLKRLGQEHQVLCVTHLPQVASQANQHYQVSKQQHEGRTRSLITSLDNKERVEEIARMLGGLEITATTRKHARELLAL